MGDKAQKLTIGGRFSTEGFVNNITENFNGVHLNENPEQRLSPSNLEKPLNSKMELTASTEPTTSKRTGGLISSWVKNNSSEKGEHSKEVNLNEHDNAEKEKALIESKKLIGRNIYKEFKGVKTLGTIVTYMTTYKLYEVFYENDNRVEYLNRNEVLSHLAENDKIYEVQLAEPQSNSLEKAIETKMEKVAFGEHVTSKRKMKDSSIMVGKSLSKKGKTSGGPSSKKASNIELIEVTPPLKETTKSKKNETSKSACKFTKKEPETKPRLWYAKRENATKEEPYEPYQFRGLYICKELKGIRSLGTVIGYSPEMNKLIIEYKTDNSIEYMTQLETLRNMAKRADIMSSPSASGSKKKTDMKEKNDDTGKASTSRT
ncbi:uncharacterized protein LOC127121455 [Lathyrus oleraceus]|uniref:Uncharacterized protein n=1 Tax=Pisum sativum TaxID=3888 RepID=A0A9D4YI71_PEA|nr:uncharacterized protein LOC127121455 [Pisum sativum]XP_050907901.1 uncharacterized protein LOC127121455 [Pisum sativum]KAI5437700.1 hypothetical protein KIW84_023714 [Pisum sativum]